MKFDRDKIVKQLCKSLNLESDIDGYYQMIFHIHLDSILTRGAAQEELIGDFADEIIQAVSK